jgi:DNA-binding beta-propeller fold protein YncE
MSQIYVSNRNWASVLLFTVLLPLSLLSLSGCGSGSGNPQTGNNSQGGSNPQGGSGNPQSLRISLLDPGCAQAGAQAFTLALMGTGFTSGSVVRWNGTNLPTTTTAAEGFLQASVPAADIAATGAAEVTVFNPSPGGGTSIPVPFSIVAGGFNPGSMAVDPTGKFAYVVNSGCSANQWGVLSMYTINPANGTLTPGSAVPTGDEGADSVAVDPTGKFVYVGNWGAGDSAGSVSMFTLNSADGTLTFTGTVAAPCDSLAIGSCAPWSLAIHPSGKFVYVANEGGFSPTSVSMYAIDAGTGFLNSLGTVAADGRASAVTVDPSGKFAYVADGGQNSDGSKGMYVSMYRIDSATGVLTSIGKIQAGTSPWSIAIHPSSKFAYISSSYGVSVYAIDATTGNLTSIATVADAGGIVIPPSGKFAYGTSSEGISKYTIDATTGVLTFAGPTVADSDITIHPSGKFAYGPNSDSGNISMYSIDSVTGALTLMGTVGP